MTDEKRGYLTLEAASEYSSIPVESLRKFINGFNPNIPKLPAIKPGKRLLINKKELDNWLKKFPVGA